jgi:hypothetical protein
LVFSGADYVDELPDGDGEEEQKARRTPPRTRNAWMFGENKPVFPSCSVLTWVNASRT